MEGFFTWQTLITYSGAALATTLITQFFKEMGPIGRMPTRLFSFITALGVILVSTVATKGIVWRELLMAPINAVVVALASNGAFDAVNSAKAKPPKSAEPTADEEAADEEASDEEETEVS